MHFFLMVTKWLLYLQALHSPSGQEEDGRAKEEVYIMKAKTCPSRQNCVTVLATRESEEVTTFS